LDALSRCCQISAEAASVGIIVDAKHESARAWYLKFGFLPFEDDAMRLFLPMGTVRQLMEADADGARSGTEQLEPHRND
jgi:hypothetical protein